jgi:hypothetical protein
LHFVVILLRRATLCPNTDVKIILRIPLLVDDLDKFFFWHNYSFISQNLTLIVCEFVAIPHNERTVIVMRRKHPGMFGSVMPNDVAGHLDRSTHLAEIEIFIDPAHLFESAVVLVLIIGVLKRGMRKCI